MYCTVHGVVLRCTDIGERDALLTILSREQGKLVVKVRGLRRRNSPLTAACQLLAFSEFSLFEYKGQYSVNEAHVLTLFQNIREDLQTLALASYFAQTAEMLALEDLPSPDLQSLLLNCLYALSELKLPCDFVKAVYEFRAACISGYAPELEGCSACGAADSGWISIDDGHLLCSDCVQTVRTEKIEKLTKGVLQALRYISACPPQRLFSFRISKEDMRILGKTTERFFLTQVDHTFPTLTFYHTFGSLAGSIRDG